ncbi:MAG TPA: hypothetical protein VK484_11805 [Ferruginibacter sp.]|nr:hypothetical protein [Ferruginibacter sp.]
MYFCFIVIIIVCAACTDCGICYKSDLHEVSDWYGYRMLSFILLPLCLIAMAVIFGALLMKLLPKVYSFVTGKEGLGDDM